MAVAVKITCGQRCAKAVAVLRHFQQAFAVLRPNLAACSGKSGSRAVDHGDGPGRSQPGETLMWYADGQVVAAVAVEVAHRQGIAKGIAWFDNVQHARRALRPDLAAGGGQSGRRTIESR